MIRGTAGEPRRVEIARVIARLEPGGAQLGALRLTLALRALGISSSVFAGEATLHGAHLFRSAGVEVEVWGRASGLQHDCSAPFAEWLRPRLAGARLVHAHMFGGWWAASQVTPAGVPLVASEHNAIRWPEAARPEEMRRALQRVDAFFAHGPAARAEVLAHGLAAELLEEGRSAIEAPTREAQPGLPTPRFVFAGRLHPEKGPDLLLDALALLANPPPLIVLGTGELAAGLRSRAAALGLTKSVSFVGWRSPIGPWLRGATACVVPSRCEAWSQTAVTAMATGVPVIGAAVEGLPETLADRRGIVVPPADPTALAAALERAIAGELNVDLAAARRYAARFTARNVALHYARVYERLVRRRAQSAAEAA